MAAARASRRSARRGGAATPKPRAKPSTPRRRPLGQGWSTSDEDERERRVRRGRDATGVSIRALEPSLAPFGAHLVALDGRSVEEGYRVELRGFEADAANTCECVDFRVNALGTCKHVEALRHALRGRADERPARRVTELLIDRRESPPVLTRSDLGRWRAGPVPESLALIEGRPRYTPARAAELRTAVADLSPAQRRRWRLAASLEDRLERDQEAQRLDRRLRRVAESVEPRATGLKLPLYPYQRIGMLHLVTRRRAILADEMGLGKTVQAIAACTLLLRLGLVRRVLVVSPASLKAEWQEQIGLFTDAHVRIVQGGRKERLAAYDEGAFFTLANYEQILRDGDDIAKRLVPDVIVLDEAQRIKNWQAKTAEAIKRLPSDWAFVLTGTPLENRIDEIYSIMQIVDPEVLGPLFRFNRAFYTLNERGAPVGYRNLDRLHELLQPHLLRRTKDQVEGDLPPCSVRTIFVPMNAEQRARYTDHEANVARLMSIARRRALLPDEAKRLQIQLGCMRMTCDSVHILDPDVRAAPKLDELEPLLDELLEGTHKIIVFSEWTKMLGLLQERLEARGVGYALHTGAVAQKRRRHEIDRFKRDPACRLFLSSESGGAGLNLQVADVVVNLDLPWNPAKLAQRIARAWRKHQTRAVQVINLVAADSIEQGMLARLESKQRLADGVLGGGLESMALPSGRGALLAQLDELMGERGEAAPAPGPTEASPDVARPTLARVLGDALERFAPALRGVAVLVDADERSLFVGAVGEPGPIERWFADALGVAPAAPSDSTAPDARRSGGWRLHIATPEFLTSVAGLHGTGTLRLAGEWYVPVVDGQLMDDALPPELRDAEARDGGDAAARAAAMRAALRDAIAPHRRALEAAALLEEGGFAEQALALQAPVRAELATVLAELTREHELPPGLDPAGWSTASPSVGELLSHAG